MNEERGIDSSKIRINKLKQIINTIYKGKKTSSGGDLFKKYEEYTFHIILVIIETIITIFFIIVAYNEEYKKDVENRIFETRYFFDISRIIYITINISFVVISSSLFIIEMLNYNFIRDNSIFIVFINIKLLTFFLLNKSLVSINTIYIKIFLCMCVSIGVFEGYLLFKLNYILFLIKFYEILFYLILLAYEIFLRK